MRLSLEECRKGVYAHNKRYRTTAGFHCEDCDIFFSKESEDYIRTELVDSMYFSCWNIRADFVRQGKDVPTSVSFMLNKIDVHKNLIPFSIPFAEVKKLISDAKGLITEHTTYGEHLHTVVIGAA